MSKIGQALGQKNGHTEVSILAKQFNEAVENYNTQQNILSLHHAQITVAKANGDTALVEQLEANKPDGWLEAYTAHKDAAKRLCEGLGIDPKELKWALPS